MNWEASERERERGGAYEKKKKKEKDQANLRRADDLFSHKQYSRFIVQEEEEKKKTKSKIRFEDDQVSDLTRRCENVNIYQWESILLIRYQLYLFVQKKDDVWDEEEEEISDLAIKARFLQRYIILMNIDTTRSIAFTVRKAVHIHQWWYDEDDDDDVDCIHITSRVCSLRWQDRQALFIIYIYIYIYRT